MNPLRLIGLIPMGMGLTILAFLWTSSFFDGFTPLDNTFLSFITYFKLIGSFVAAWFVVIGGVIVFGQVPGWWKDQAGAFQSLLNNPNAFQSLHRRRRSSRMSPPSATNYTCSKCGAGLGGDAEVSPLGDVKCSQCGRWFNVHQSN